MESADSRVRVPCYLLSSARAGSTLLSRILDSHRQICSPCELCIPYVVRSSWKMPRSLRAMKQVCAYYGAAYPRMAPLLLLRGVARGHWSQLIESILEREGKQLLVAKDPRHAEHVSRIEELHPNQPPRYILLHRDARAVAQSFRRTLHRDFDRAFAVWKAATTAMIRCQETLPAGRCYALTFEDVVAEPRRTIEQLVRFLGYHFEPEMLEYGRFEHADDQLNLWRNKKLIASVNCKAVKSGAGDAWREDDEVCEAYASRPDICELNQQLGYDAPVAEAEEPELEAVCLPFEPAYALAQQQGSKNSRWRVA